MRVRVAAARSDGRDPEARSQGTNIELAGRVEPAASMLLRFGMGDPVCVRVLPRV